MDEEYSLFQRKPEEDQEPEMTYREHQAYLRELGFTPYNSDYVDEFPHW